MQLLRGTAHGRCIFTFSFRDCLALAARYPRHEWMVLAAQSLWTLPALIAALDRLLGETQAQEWADQVRWLDEWREVG